MSAIGTPARTTSAHESGPALSAADLAYRELRRRIVDAELAGGTMISEGPIADELGMSRTPVREAFLRLQAEGWMRLYPKRGALVVEAAPGEREDILGARILIETDAVRHIADDAPARGALAERLTEIVAQQRDAARADDLGAFSSADAEFHAAIVHAGGNRLLATFFGTLRDRQRRMTAMSLWNRAERVDRVIADHEALARIIANGDVQAFETALTAHVRDAHKELLA